MSVAGRVMVFLAPLCLLGPTPSPAASGHEVAETTAEETATSVPLEGFRGLRSLFVLVQLDLEAQLGAGAPLAIVLGSPEERDELIEATPVERREAVALTHALAVGRWAEFERVAAAVLDPGAPRPFDYREVLDAFTGTRSVSVVAKGHALARDRLVEKMAIVVYWPYLIAEVVSGHMPVEAVEQANRLRVLGRSESEITRYLERRAEARARAQAMARAALRVWSAGVASLAAPEAVRGARDTTNQREQFEPAVVRSSVRHRVDPDLVRAVIRHESGWNP